MTGRLFIGAHPSEEGCARSWFLSHPSFTRRTQNGARHPPADLRPVCARQAGRKAPALHHLVFPLFVLLPRRLVLAAITRQGTRSCPDMDCGAMHLKIRLPSKGCHVAARLF